MASERVYGGVTSRKCTKYSNHSEYLATIWSKPKRATPHRTISMHIINSFYDFDCTETLRDASNVDMVCHSSTLRNDACQKCRIIFNGKRFFTRFYRLLFFGQIFMDCEIQTHTHTHPPSDWTQPECSLVVSWRNRIWNRCGNVYTMRTQWERKQCLKSIDSPDGRCTRKTDVCIDASRKNARLQCVHHTF